MSSRTFSGKHMQISPEVTGAPLASPFLRAVAFGIDFAIVLLPSLALSVGIAYYSLSVTDPRGLAGIRALLRHDSSNEAAMHEALKGVLPVLARIEAPGLPPRARAAIEDGKLDEAVELVRGYDYLFSLKVGEFEKPPLKPMTINVEIGDLIPKAFRFIALYGVAAAYFTLLSAGRRGATVGKRLTGIRVARIDGHRLSLLESLERVVGYLHIPRSFGVSILDLWRDPDRRLPHDRVVHTAVLKVTRE
jgi:hypothetical protein